jgi:hypothetical protein
MSDVTMFWGKQSGYVPKREGTGVAGVNEKLPAGQLGHVQVQVHVCCDVAA